MQNDELTKRKKEILSGLMLKEEDTLDELSELVELSKNSFKIEKETGKVIFNRNLRLANREKITLLLCGRYFAKESGLLNEDGINISDISKELSVPTTTLSAPLGELVRDGTIRKTDDGLYKVVHHQIKSVLSDINGAKK